MVSVVSRNAPFVGAGLLRPLCGADSGFVGRVFEAAAVRVGGLCLGDVDFFVGDAAERWELHKTDIGVLTLPGAGEPCGLAGLRVVEGAGGAAELRLYVVSTGQLSEVRVLRHVVRELVCWAARYAPSLRVRCSVGTSDEDVVNALRGAGMYPVSARVMEGGGDSVVVELPHLEVVRDADDVPVEEVLDVWCAVNDAGGAVGFLPGAPRDFVRQKLDTHLESMRGGESVLSLLREPSGAIVAVAWWERLAPSKWGPDRSHVVKVYRFMVHPHHQKRGLGDVFMSAGHGIVDQMDGVLFSFLDYRDGAGLEQFYGRHGYVEVGRYPQYLSCPEPDGSVVLKDGVTMRRVVNKVAGKAE